jgi:hypothetical protein
VAGVGGPTVRDAWVEMFYEYKLGSAPEFLREIPMDSNVGELAVERMAAIEPLFCTWDRSSHKALRDALVSELEVIYYG